MSGRTRPSSKARPQPATRAFTMPDKERRFAALTDLLGDPRLDLGG
jgi:hypothetical protein